VHKHDELLAKAKEAWKQKQAQAKGDNRESSCAPRTSALSRTDPAHAVVTDPDDPRFDLEKIIAKYENAS
jgi:F-type H+-transporting ATP synthase subunit e